LELILVDTWWMGDSKEHVICKSVSDWRDWLLKNHLSQREVWLVFFKNEKAKTYVNYDQALDEALCFGWIDNLVKRINDEKYAIRFARRREKSKWSPGNKARVERLIAGNRLSPAGTAVVEAAKANGTWENTKQQPLVSEIPIQLKDALKKNEKAGKP